MSVGMRQGKLLVRFWFTEFLEQGLLSLVLMEALMRADPCLPLPQVQAAEQEVVAC